MRLPISTSVTGPASMRPGSPAPVADMSGIARGAANLAGSVGRIVKVEQDKVNTIDLARADAFATRSFLDMQNEFGQDGDYATFNDRAEAQTQEISSAAAEMIRDPEMRQKWLAAHEVNRIRQVDAIGDVGRGLANEAERVSFGETLTDYARIIEEPGTPEDVRANARLALDGTLQVARETGLLTPAEEAKARADYLDTAEQNLALNTADSLIRSNPEAVTQGMGIVPDPNDPLDATRTSVRLPVVAARGVNVQDVDPAALTRWEQVQGAFGKQLEVISGSRDDEHNDAAGGASNSQHLPSNGSKAIDVDVSSLSKEERIRLIETASAMGFTGIGVYNNSLHFDTGATRAWGPSHGSESVPAWASDVIGRHTGKQIAEVPVGAAAGVDPRFAALSYPQRAALFDQAKQEIDKRNMEVRASIETTAENAPVAIARSGGYDGYMPTANDFVVAYGARDGLERFEQFDASVKVSQDTFAMRTMTADEIASIVEQAVPTDTGDGAALQEKSFAQISTAAQATIKAREEDPAGYVQQVYPAVAQAWQGVSDDDPASFKRALTLTGMAQEQLGMPMQLLPKEMAANVAATFNDATKSDQERIGALTGVVLATSDQDQQAAIFDQLVTAGVPGGTIMAMNALERGDNGAAQRLMAAVMAPPEMLNKSLPGNIKGSEVDNTLQAQVFDTDGIGEVYYDLAYGSQANVAQAAEDTAIMTNSVKLRLLDGSAGGNIQRAIDMTVKDMFGDVKVVTGGSSGGSAGMKVLLPADADQGVYQQGFDALLGQVGESLARDLERDADSVFGPIPPGTAGQAILDTQIANYVEQALANGYFSNSGGEEVFKFMDPNGRGPIEDASGQPLMFTREQVLAAQATAGAVPAGMMPDPVRQAGAAFGAAVQRPQ